VSYIITGKRGAYEPRSKQFAIDGVNAVVAATKIDDRGMRTVRRQKTRETFAKTFAPLWGDGGAPQAAVFASVGNRDDVTLILKLSNPSFNANSGTLTFTAEQVPPADGAAASGGAAEQLVQEVAKSGSWLRAVSRVNMVDPVVVIDGRSQ
jgi:hypothetical protein